jgi:general stress protein 26
MKDKVIDILDRHRLMAIATLRSDGWPQTTTVGYANDGLLIYFLISRQSQKFANLARDDRASIAVGGGGDDLSRIRALSLAAHVSEVADRDQRDLAWRSLLKRHPAYRSFPAPDYGRAAMMRARCTIATVLDYSQGFGHADVATVGTDQLVTMAPARPDDWGLGPAPEGSRHAD